MLNWLAWGSRNVAGEDTEYQQPVLNWLQFPGGWRNVTGWDCDCKFRAELRSQRTQGCKERIMTSAALITFRGPGIETDKNRDSVLYLTGKADYPVASNMAGKPVTAVLSDRLWTKLWRYRNVRSMLEIGG